jgi:hypothetical protein
MLIQDLAFCLQVIVDSKIPRKLDDCLLNPPCGCTNPGKELKCEDCEHLEACMSRFRSVKLSGNTKVVQKGENKKRVAKRCRFASRLTL